MAGGGGFAGALSNYLISHFSGKLADVLVFVPTSRVAAQVRARLSLEITGVLPAILPLRGNGELADLLGLEMGSVAAAAAVRIEIAQILKRLGSEDEDERVRLEAVKGERLWRRVEGLYKMLDRLALYGISSANLRNTVPQNMVGLWEAQAATLLEVSAHMERWLARRGEVLAGAAERRVLEQAAKVLSAADCPWTLVTAGILDGIPAAHAMVQVAATRGRVVVPELGMVTNGLIAELETAVGRAVERVAMQAGAVKVGVAETDWDEAWMAALGVRRALDSGVKRVGVVSPSRELLRRVSGILSQWDLRVPVRGEMCLDHTVAGREILAVREWGLKGGRASDWLEALGGFEGARLDGYEGFEAVRMALEPLRENSAWLDLDDWRSLMALVLGETAAAAGPLSEGVLLMGPLDARLLDFDYVIAAGCVEGTWPASANDAWLSEAHLRALGLPDSARTAQLAGTEFESVVKGGSREVLLLRSRTVEGRETVPSRFMDGVAGAGIETELGEVLEALRGVEGALGDGVLGTFVPTGKLWPKRWSASFVEAMLACPYKAMGDRVLRLTPPDALTPDVDARMAGLLAHRWLEKAGKEITSVTVDTAKQMEARLLEIGEMELRTEPPVIRAIWRAKMKKLAPALVAQWLADGRSVAAIEKKLSRDVGAITVTAKLDRVEAGASGSVIIDYKTSTPPSWSSVARGERPQLAIEAWLMGEAEPVANVEYWQLQGYGMTPLKVHAAKNIDALVEPVTDGVARLETTFGEGAPFPAVPDMEGGGLMATGHCERCVLAGVCRRKEAGMRG